MIQRIVAHPAPPINRVEPVNGIELQRQQSQFAEILRSKLTGVTISAHAQSRLSQRNIQLTAQDLSKLENAIDKIAAKGGRDSLIQMEDTTFVVNVPNRTVVTAMDSESARDNVWTNIDSAVFIR